MLWHFGLEHGWSIAIFSMHEKSFFLISTFIQGPSQMNTLQLNTCYAYSAVIACISQWNFQNSPKQKILNVLLMMLVRFRWHHAHHNNLWKENSKFTKFRCSEEYQPCVRICLPFICGMTTYGFPTLISMSVLQALFFFPGLFFYVYIESPNPKNPAGPTPQAPNPINWKHQTQKPDTRPQPQNPKPQTTINEPK